MCFHHVIERTSLFCILTQPHIPDNTCVKVPENEKAASGERRLETMSTDNLTTKDKVIVRVAGHLFFVRRLA